VSIVITTAPPLHELQYFTLWKNKHGRPTHSFQTSKDLAPIGFYRFNFRVRRLFRIGVKAGHCHDH
jgi:hypothetical protein